MINRRGQTALVLILLSAAALIFLAITINWGRIAQEKSMLSIAADQSASLLASDAASYGESQKQNYLNDTNSLTQSTGLILALFAVVVSIVIAWYTAGTATGPMASFLIGLAWAGAALAVANLVLQAAVIQPGITYLWNTMQKDQPAQEQFFEQGISTALQGAATDNVNITDYYDLNTNGVFGVGPNAADDDTISRLGLFYTERLKMLQPGIIPQINFFYNQLNEVMNGQTCAQNYLDNTAYPNIIPVNANCIDPSNGVNYCVEDPSGPLCNSPISGGFKLNDACTDSDDANSEYNPYCDPCCQPLTDVNGNKVRPSYCVDQNNDVPVQCYINNPFNTSPGAGSPYPFLYDPRYQEQYGTGTSFLDQFGRDQQRWPFDTLTPETEGNPTDQVYFPDGLYPFFWRMKDYSPEVDNINVSSVSTQQLHWCAPATKAQNGGASIPVAPAAPPSFPDLAQLNLGYFCQGQDCCVNFLADQLGTVNNEVSPIIDPKASTGTVNPPIDLVSSPSFPYQGNPVEVNPAKDPNFALEGSAWTEGDNQLCLSTWPYNGASMTGPSGTIDGTCEMSNTNSVKYTPEGSIDAIDSAMHTMQDFTLFGSQVLNQSIAQLTSSFDTWYVQAAEWIDPTDNGRLLTLYDPLGYPGFGGQSNSTAVDVFNDWNSKVITPWLDLNYTSNNAWCVPPESSLLINGNQSTPTAEDSYINKNSGSVCPDGNKCITGKCSDGSKCDATWGDMPHVLACLNYNAGPTAATQPANVASYQNCLNFLIQSCPNPGAASLNGTVCDPSLVGAPPSNVTFTGTYRCTPYYVDPTTQDPSYANWISNNISFGAQYNYQNCLDLLQNMCPASLTNTVCDPKFLGRSMTNEAYRTYQGNKQTDCNPTATFTVNHVQVPSYAHWVNDNVALFTDEAPKFVARSQYLTPVYNTALNMQTIFNAADQELSVFLKPCAPTDAACESGGPAAQLLYVKAHPPAKAVLPNSVIYGWQDNTPTGGSGGCYNQGARVGCSHIVKVTSFSPGREGSTNFSSPGIQPNLPKVITFCSDDLCAFGACVCLARTYQLNQQDGYVYVKIQRWDQNHTSPVIFPNQHSLWQFGFNNPTTSAMGNGLPPSCFDNVGGVGFGLGPAVTSTLSSMLKPDQDSLGDGPYDQGGAYMLNDNGSGQVDTQGSSGGYGTCISDSNMLLATGIQSEACAEYIGWRNANQTPSTQNGDSSEYDYSLKFVDCNSIDGGNSPSSSP